MIAQLAVTSLALLAAAESTDAELRASRLMIYTLRSDGQELGTFARDLTERLVAHVATLGKQHKLTVLSEGDVALMVNYVKDESDLTLEDCQRASACLAQIAEQAQAGRILSGRVEQFDDNYVGILSLMDTELGVTIASQSCAAADKEELTETMLRIAGELLGFEANAPRSKLEHPISSANRKVGVIPLEGVEDQPAIASYLSENLAVELLKLGFSVTTRGEQIMLLRDAVERHELGKREQPLAEILVEIAGAMGVDYLVSGIVERVEPGHFVLVLKLVDIVEAKVLNRVAESVRGPMSQLPLALRFTTAELAGHEISGEGALSIVSEVEGQFRVDQSRSELLPRTEAVRGLKAGKHDLHISAEGYKPYFANLYIEPSEDPTRFTPELEEVDPRWFESIWFWSIVGVAAAATTGAILLATVPPEGVNVGGGL
jgi:hypothetical protein